MNNNPQNSYYESKFGIGILLGLFLGIIGLVIGLCIYPENSYSRKTFIKGWAWAFCVCIGIVILIFLIFYILYINALGTWMTSLS